MFERKLNIPLRAKESFFLWGARQTGKSTYLNSRFPDALYIDLLDSTNFRELSQNPERLSARAKAKRFDLIIIDEIQKVPALLDEVQRMIVNQRIRFGMCGSSARKLRHGHANLLGGRAIRYEMSGLVSSEIGERFDLKRALNHGNLPEHYLHEDPKAHARSYVADYLKEEIAAEGLVRNLPSFSTFLDLVSLSDTELVSYSSFARDTGVAVNTVKEYFQILVDTLLARFVSPYIKRPKRRVVQTPKYYFSNVATVNFLAKRGTLEPRSELYGKAFENWVCHELHSYSQYSEKWFDVTYWRLASGIEVDFILGDMEVAIEVKAVEKFREDHLKGLRSLKEDHPKIKKRILVTLEKNPLKTSDGIWVLPWKDFFEKLWWGEWI